MDGHGCRRGFYEGRGGRHKEFLTWMLSDGTWSAVMSFQKSKNEGKGLLVEAGIGEPGRGARGDNTTRRIHGMKSTKRVNGSCLLKLNGIPFGGFICVILYYGRGLAHVIRRCVACVGVVTSRSGRVLPGKLGIKLPKVIAR